MNSWLVVIKGGKSFVTFIFWYSYKSCHHNGKIWYVWKRMSFTTYNFFFKIRNDKLLIQESPNLTENMNHKFSM